jgi:hypothetical protein
MLAAQLLAKHGNTTTSQVTTELVLEIAQVFGTKLSNDSASQLANSISTDSDEKLSNWVMRPENVERLKFLATEKRDPLPGNDHTVVVCPHCREFIDLSN